MFSAPQYPVFRAVFNQRDIPDWTPGLKETLQQNHGSPVITAEFSKSEATFLKDLSHSKTLNTICKNLERCKTVTRQVTSAEDLASTKKRVSNGSQRENVGVNNRAKANDKQIECILHLSCLWC
ncbi:hypothetical protein TNCV_1992991 [Trichonephila clavipes]|nr:hypothetical protein TNCV_1992991 [Trichonephila clavipes]